MTRKLAIPFALGLAYVLYLTFVEERSDISFYMIPLGLILSVLYVLQPQIDFYYLKRQPPNLASQLKSLLQKIPFYQNLNTTQKGIFEKRLELFMNAKAFMAMGSDTVPEDLKMLLSIPAIQLTFLTDNFLFKNYDRIVVYKHPFPSPHHQYLHTSESNDEDGVFIFSIEQAIPGIFQQKGAFNICLYEYAKVYIKMFSQNLPIITKEDIIDGGFPVEKFKQTIGMEVDYVALAVSLLWRDEGFLSKIPKSSLDPLRKILKLI